LLYSANTGILLPLCGIRMTSAETYLSNLLPQIVPVDGEEFPLRFEN